jgi:DNA mismatch repair protein MSH5
MGPRVDFAIPEDIDMYEGYNEKLKPGLASQQGKRLRLSSWIDLNSHVSVGCAGTVLAYLHRRRISTYLPRDEDANSIFRVCFIEMFSLKGIM